MVIWLALEEGLHCSMHDYKRPDGAAVSQQRMLCIIVVSTERLDWKLDEPSASVALAVGVASWSSHNTCAVGDFDGDKIVILTALDAYFLHVVGPCVLQDGIEERLCDLSGLDCAFHVRGHGTMSVHVYL